MRSIKSLILLLFAFGVVTLNSCKKDKDSAPSATISASVDGTPTNFNIGAIAVQGSVNGTAITNIEGTAANKTAISITISGTPVAGKTYSNTASNDDDKPLIAYILTDDDQYLNDDSQSNPASLTITSVTSTTVEGTFKGDLVDIQGATNGTAKKKVITNGKFNVTLKKQ